MFGHFLKVYDKVTSSYEKEKKPHLKTKKLIQQCAVTYLLKNKLEFANQPEDPAKYRQYRRKKEIQVEQLEKQLKARLPKGRNLTKDEYLEALEQAKCLITENQEIDLLQVRLLRSEQLVPFPVSYNTNTDIYWLKNEQGRIYVTFNGLTKHTFEVCCNNRQLHWFQRFYEDFELYKQNKKQIPAGLITLRSVSLIWKKRESKDVDRLLAKAIVEMAIQYRVNSIVLPDLKNVREILNSEIQVKAEAKAPGCKKAQKQYAKNYRKSIHRWSYARLCDAIASKANQKGIAIECKRQSSQGKPEIQARDLALTAYRDR